MDKNAKPMPGNLDEHCLCVLVLDVSGSMKNHGRLDSLNGAIKQFHEDIVWGKQGIDQSLKGKLDVAIIKYDQEPTLVRPAGEDLSLLLSKDEPLPELTSRGSTTDTVKAMRFALQFVDEVKSKYYKATGLSYKRPWIVIMSDGKSSSSETDTAKLVVDLSRLKTDKRINLLGIAVGEVVDLEHLKRITLGNAKALSNDGFFKFFAWLSKSLSASLDMDDEDEMDNQFEEITKDLWK